MPPTIPGALNFRPASLKRLGGHWRHWKSRFEKWRLSAWCSNWRLKPECSDRWSPITKSLPRDCRSRRKTTSASLTTWISAASTVACLSRTHSARVLANFPWMSRRSNMTRSLASALSYSRLSSRRTQAGHNPWVTGPFRKLACSLKESKAQTVKWGGQSPGKDAAGTTLSMPTSLSLLNH